MRKWEELPEVAPYLAEPAPMRVGTPGKWGRLCLGFRREASGRSLLARWERHAPLIVQRALYFDEELPQMPCLYILSSGGPQVDGDRFEQDIHLEAGSMAHISTGAATKIAQMRANFSALEQRITLESGAYLEYLPEPTIPCRHSRYCVQTELVIDLSATLFHSEIYLSGRRHHNQEHFAYDLLSLSMRVIRPDGSLLYGEKQLLQPAQWPLDGLGIMGSFSIFANVLILLPAAHATVVERRIDPFYDRQRRLALGVQRLPEGCGLTCRVLGDESDSVKQAVRSLCSRVREVVKGHPLPPEFPWR